MTSKVKPIPEGYHSVTPHLVASDAAGAIEFYKKAFGATEIIRHADPGGKIRNAEVKIGDSMIMLADEFPEMGVVSPRSLGGSPVSFYLYVKDVDQVHRQALAAGGEEIYPVTDKFYGDRSGGVKDPFGHSWYIATHVEDVSPEELQRRAQAQAAKEH